MPITIKEPLVVTVILNTNRRDDTLACLASLACSTYARNHILLLDNGSTDGSAEAVAKAFPAVEILQLTHNLGYAGNNNVGIEAALARSADWVFVLNEDTLLEPGCVAALVEAGEADAQIGVVGPKVLHAGETAIIQSAGGRMDRYWRSSHRGQNEPDTGQYDAQRDVDWISGCAICVRAEAIRRAGMLDAAYFYYWEETEWCLRLRQHGYRIRYAPAAVLRHKGVQVDYQPKPSVGYYNTRNRLQTLAKHNAPLAARAVAYGEIARTLASYTLRPKWRDRRAHRDAIWRGLRDHQRGRLGPMAQ